MTSQVKRLALVLLAVVACSDSTAPIFPVEPIIVSGLRHTCRLASDGVVACWGSNSSGQLGDGSYVDRATPTPIAANLRFVAVVAGGYHTCALTDAGAAYCWGYGAFGNLGTDPPASSEFPVPVSGGLKFVSLAAGGTHTCGITDAGDAYCWGANYAGQLGDSSDASHNVPTLVHGHLQFSALAAGATHTCGLTTARAAYCWGENLAGKLGTGAEGPPKTVPTPVAGNHAFVMLEAGANHTCALTATGTAYCWGENHEGQIGNGSEPAQAEQPALVAAGGMFSKITAGATHTCAMTSAGAASCWGRSYEGEAGGGTITAIAAPGPVAGALSFTSIAAGGQHTCGLTATGTYCWGSNLFGQAGVPYPRALTPAPTSGLTSAVSIVSGSSASTTCALTNSDLAYCWGENTHGNLGIGTRMGSGTPQAVASGTLKFRALAVAALHTCGITVDSAAYCWGFNQWGEVGNGTWDRFITSPVAVAGNRSFSSVANSAIATCALSDSAKAYCWGNRDVLGDSADFDSNSPVAVVGGMTFVGISAGQSHVCARTASNAAYCWGYGYGALGDSSTALRDYPVPVAGGLAFSSVTAGGSHTCGLTTTGAAYCWGWNDFGQLGDGSTMERIVPVPVAAGLMFSVIATGMFHTCGLTSTGAAYCWGNNVVGQLGTGSTASSLTPVPVSGTLQFAQLTAGSHHTCGLTTGGSVYCWGNDYDGQLGRGSVGYYAAPVAVAGS